MEELGAHSFKTNLARRCEYLISLFLVGFQGSLVQKPCSLFKSYSERYPSMFIHPSIHPLIHPSKVSSTASVPGSALGPGRYRDEADLVFWFWEFTVY